jgi:hypothetical protein
MVRERKTPTTDGNEALRVLRVLDAADRSMRTGNWVELGENS